MSASTVWSKSASGITTRWFLAPPRAWTRLPASVAARCTRSAMGVEPTKLTAATSGCAMRRVHRLPISMHHVEHAGGKPASTASSAIRTAADGSRSEGLRTKVLPQAIATGNIHIGTIAGKLKGVMPTHTPRGWRKE